MRPTRPRGLFAAPLSTGSYFRADEPVRLPRMCLPRLRLRG